MPTLAPQFYQVATLDALVGLGLARAAGVVSADPVPDPPLAFGLADLSALAIDEYPRGIDWHPIGSGIIIPPAARYEFEDATVHGPEGVVTIGRHVVAPTLDHVWPPWAGAWRDGQIWLMRSQFTAVRVPAAEHLLYGNPGNYYHWLLDGLGRWSLSGDGLALLPWTGAAFQQDGPALIPGLSARALTISPGQAIGVGRLGWTGSLTGFGTQFHPALRCLGVAMRGMAGRAAGPDLYLCRDDAPRRPLRNEAAVARLCADRGFRTVRMADMPMAEQVALFAGARRIVAPHGAGLANLLFSSAGAALLELHMDRYVNWCFRRLAATMGVRYGCVIGSAEPGGGSVHDWAWSIDLDRLVATLDDPAF